MCGVYICFGVMMSNHSPTSYNQFIHFINPINISCFVFTGLCIITKYSFDAYKIHQIHKNKNYENIIASQTQKIKQLERRIEKQTVRHQQMLSDAHFCNEYKLTQQMEMVEDEKMRVLMLEAKVKRLVADNIVLCKLANRDRNRGILMKCCVSGYNQEINYGKRHGNNVKRIRFNSDVDDRGIRDGCHCDDVSTHWGVGDAFVVGDEHVIIRTASCEI